VPEDDEDDEDAEAMVRRAIGGDAAAITWITRHADTSGDAAVITMAAVLEWSQARIDHAQSLATTSRDRQAVAIARAHLAGRRDLVDALARDHLADHPGSILVAWIASGAAGRTRATDAC
jgi:hypothetical protein